MEKIRDFFVDDSAKTSEITDVQQYRYMKILQYGLLCINSWPGDSVVSKKVLRFIGMVNVAQLLVNVSVLGYYTLGHVRALSLNDVGHIFIVWFISILATTRIFFTFPEGTKFKDVINQYLTKIHLYYFKDSSEYAMETHKRIHFISHVFTLALTAQMVSCSGMFNIIPMWDNFTSGKFKYSILQNTTYEHALFYPFPLEKDTHFYPYVLYTAYNCYLSHLTSTLFCMVDLQLSLVAFTVWGHFKILIHELETFPLPANETVISLPDSSVRIKVKMYTKQESEVIAQSLKRCIDYHRNIKAFTNTMSDAFGPILLIYYAYHQVSGCLLLLECAQMTAEAFLQYLPLALVVFQELIQISVIFELIGSTSEKLKDAVYGVPWEYMDKKNRKTVAIFLMNVQEPIHVKALGVVDVGVTSMATILKTTLSYFTFLQSIK